MEFKIGDRIISTLIPTGRNGTITDIRYVSTINGTKNKIFAIKVKWVEDDKNLYSHLSSTWVKPGEIVLNKEVIRDDKLNQLGI